MPLVAPVRCISSRGLRWTRVRMGTGPKSREQGECPCALTSLTGALPTTLLDIQGRVHLHLVCTPEVLDGWPGHSGAVGHAAAPGYPVGDRDRDRPYASHNALVRSRGHSLSEEDCMPRPGPAWVPLLSAARQDRISDLGKRRGAGDLKSLQWPMPPFAVPLRYGSKESLFFAQVRAIELPPFMCMHLHPSVVIPTVRRSQ